MIEKPWESEDLLIRLSFWAFKFCGKGEQENMASDTMSEAKTRIEELERYQSLHAQCEKVSLELEKKLVEQLKIAHSRLPQWQPIETAPKDDTDVLVLCDHGIISIGSFCGTMWWIEQVTYEKREPTHWMPLPERPRI
jgi:hypothetical protein